MKKNSLANKKIILGVTGSISAYKACELVRLLDTAGAQVHVVMTKSAVEFIAPLSFQALSKNPVRTHLFDLSDESRMNHIELADTADLICVAPASADLIAKATHGQCDDLLSTILLVTRSPILIAPAMNVNMYEHPATQENISTLKKRGVHFVGPEKGDLACGWTGSGRLSDPEKIVEAIKKIL